jgi:hypothetical protein
MSYKSSIGVVLLAAVATYFSMPLAKKVKSGEPVDLTDVSPALISWLLALITAVTGQIRSAAPHPAAGPDTE